MFRWYTTRELCQAWDITPRALSKRIQVARKLGFAPTQDHVRFTGGWRGVRGKSGRKVRGDYALMLDRLVTIRLLRRGTLILPPFDLSACPSCRRPLL